MVVTEFPVDKKMKDGFNSWCKVCRREYKSTQRQLDLSKVAKQKHRQENYDSYRKIERTRELKKYGLTYEQWEQMMVAQNNKCAIPSCPNKNGDMRRTLHVDHDHETGKVRALLCSHCNTVLGKVDDSPERLDELKEYLIRHRSAG